MMITSHNTFGYGHAVERVASKTVILIDDSSVSSKDVSQVKRLLKAWSRLRDFVVHSYGLRPQPAPLEMWHQVIGRYIRGMLCSDGGVSTIDR